MAREPSVLSSRAFNIRAPCIMRFERMLAPTPMVPLPKAPPKRPRAEVAIKGAIDAQLNPAMPEAKLLEILMAAKRRPMMTMYPNSAVTSSGFVGFATRSPIEPPPKPPPGHLIFLATRSTAHKKNIRMGAKTAFLRSELHQVVHPYVLSFDGSK